jgi:cell division septation protein DedD
MGSRTNRDGAGDRVLESKHVIGLFMLMLVFSGVFFSLGYVMGRNQYDGQVRASMNPKPTAAPLINPKSDAIGKKSAGNAKPDASTDATEPPSSDWGFYNAGKTPPDDTLRPAPPAATAAVAGHKDLPHAPNSATKVLNASQVPSGSFTVQVAAVRRESEALNLATNLQKKKFPAFVLSPQTDKYFHVRVGPYSDQKFADAAKKGLENAGFKAIVKH